MCRSGRAGAILNWGVLRRQQLGDHVARTCCADAFAFRRLLLCSYSIIRLPLTVPCVHVQIMPVEYPGCNSRLKEAKAQSISELAAAAVQGLLPYLQSQPYVLFGHSLGAWVAFEVAQLLEANQDPDIRRPSALFVSGVRSPALVGVAYDPDGTEMHKLDPDQFWRAYERRYGHNPELVRATCLSFRNLGAPMCPPRSSPGATCMPHTPTIYVHPVFALTCCTLAFIAAGAPYFEKIFVPFSQGRLFAFRDVQALQVSTCAVQTLGQHS